MILEPRRRPQYLKYLILFTIIIFHIWIGWILLQMTYELIKYKIKL